MRYNTLFRPALLALTLTLGAAQASTGVTIDSPRIVYQMQPGGSVTGIVNVQNPGFDLDGVRVNVKHNDWLLTLQGDPQFLSPGSHPRSLSNWLNLPNSDFALALNGSRDVRYTIQVPQDAKPGLYWGVLFFNGQGKASTEKVEKGVKLQFNVNVGHVIYVKVGGVSVEGKITGMKSTLEGGKLTVSSTVRNSGTMYLNLTGRVELRDSSGKVVAQKPVQNGLVLPGYSRVLDSSFENLATGKYLALALFEYEPGKFYTGELAVTIP